MKEHDVRKIYSCAYDEHLMVKLRCLGHFFNKNAKI